LSHTLDTLSVYAYMRILERRIRVKIRVNITLEESNWKKLQHRALDEETSASAIIDKLVADYLKKSPKKGGK